ncbi:MAG: hypothetical protein O3B92_01290, partial [Actinobacteria bacterium]|nr:hypothetical protein [Actinomycetota bacterium]
NFNQNYSRRILFGTSLPFSKYSALCADDDVFAISSLSKVVKTLTRNKELDAVVGRTAMYRKAKEFIWFMKYHDLKDSDLARSNNVAVRLHNENRAPWLYYGVVKTPLWKKMLEITFGGELLKTEKILRIVDRALCRIRILEVILWVRQDKVVNKNMDPNTRSYSEYRASRQDSLFKKLFHEQNFKERKKESKQVFSAIRYASPEMKSFRAKRLARKTIKPKIIRSHFKSKKFMKSFTRKFLRIFSFVSVETKKKIDRFLPVSVSGWLGYNPISLDRMNATKRTDLDGFISFLSKTDIGCDVEELKSFEKLLMMPREELRLRANM